jgi:uncharacterized protein YigE (DUF2233 family)
MKLLPALLGLLLSATLHAEWNVSKTETLPTLNPALRQVHKVLGKSGDVEMDLLFFNARELAFRVVDNPGNAVTLDDAMEKTDCLAGVNGGFFHPDDTPLGLLLSDGKTIHPLEHAKLLSGLVVVTGKRTSLLRTGELKSTKNIQQAIQAGPFLVDHGKIVVGLNAKRAAERTAVLTDGEGHFALVLCRIVTLAEMAEILTEPGIITEMKVERALNLDGGSSSALWVRGGFYSPERKHVRNFLAIVPR